MSWSNSPWPRPREDVRQDITLIGWLGMTSMNLLDVFFLAFSSLCTLQYVSPPPPDLRGRCCAAVFVTQTWKSQDILEFFWKDQQDISTNLTQIMLCFLFRLPFVTCSNGVKMTTSVNLASKLPRSALRLNSTEVAVEASWLFSSCSTSSSSFSNSPSRNKKD